MEGSVSGTRRKMESASRCLDGEEGAVNWKTAGDVSETLFFRMKSQRWFVRKHWHDKPDSMRDDWLLRIVPGMIPLRTRLVITRNLRGGGMIGEI